MKVYLAHPQHSPKTCKVIFYTKFTTTMSHMDLKRNSSFFQSLKDNKVYIRSMAIETMENVCAGFFLGKVSQITNLTKMRAFVHSRLSKILQTEVAPFQLIHNILGPRELSTCSKIWLNALDVILEFYSQHWKEFFHHNQYPFISFQVFYHLSELAETRYYCKSEVRTEGKQITEYSFLQIFKTLTQG